MRARTSFATSCSTSFRFAHGRITLLAPARCAPNTFSLIPPTGDTRPRSVICGRTTLKSEREQRKEVMLTSPVMAVVGGTHFPVKRDTIAQTYTRPATRHLATNPFKKSGLRTIATPALGPSFFCAPAGRCRCTSIMASGMRSGSCARLVVMPRSYACVLTQLSASSALSLIT
jgi:hypothetical protein